MKRTKTLRRFGLDLYGGKGESLSAVVQFKVIEADQLVIGPNGRVATAVISDHLRTTREIDNFVELAKAEITALGAQAKVALGRANPSL